MDDEDEFSSNGSVSMEDISLEEEHIPTDESFSTDVRQRINEKLVSFYQYCSSNNSFFEAFADTDSTDFGVNANILYAKFLNIICPQAFDVLLVRNEADSKVVFLFAICLN